MTERDLIFILESEGWSVSRDETDDCFCRMATKSLLLQIIPTIKERSDHFRVSFMPSLSTRDFSEAVDRIANGHSGYEPVIVSSFVAEKIATPCIEDIIKLSKQAINWAEEQDIEMGLRRYRELPTSSKGAMPLRHLAALAINGDVKRLSFYKEGFMKGDRFDFVPYIKIHMLNESLAIATEHMGGSDFEESI